MGTVNGFCSVLFCKLGYSIGKYPKLYIILPVFVSILLSTGVLRFNFVNDIDYLFSLKDGLAHHERDRVAKYFPLNSSEKFTPSRLVFPGRYARFIITRQDEESILNSETWSEIMEVDRALRAVTIEHDGQKYNYSELCATWNGVCYDNVHLGLGALLGRIENGSLRLSYPIMFNPDTFDAYAMHQFFGGFTFENGSTNQVASAKAIDIIYFTKTDNEEQDSLGLKWEYAVVDRFTELASHWKQIKVTYGTFMSMTIEPQRNTFSVFPYLAFSVTLMFLFVMLTSLTGDWVTSKPWVAFMGVISALLGASASVGVLCYLNVPFIGVNTAIPFIALGVGVDDTFVMLAAFWKTSRLDPVPIRIAEAYADCAVSITITSLTDMLSFYVGILSPAPAIQIFCAYAGTAILFIYIFHIFFFGGVLALGGYFESENRHSFLLWRKAVPKSKADDLSGFSRWFLIGGRDPEEVICKKEPIKENALMEFFKTSFAPFLEKGFVKGLILVVYVGYLAVALWGVNQLDVGLKTANLVRDDSYLHDHYTVFDEYFRKYPYRLQMTITSELDYSQKETQDRVLSVFENATSMKYTIGDYQENWLKDFLRYINNYGEFYDFNITTEQDFIDTLRQYYLTDTSYYSEDVKFNDNFTKIIASRFIVQTFDVLDSTGEKQLLSKMREISQGSGTTDMVVDMYHPLSTLFEMTLALKSMTVMLVGIAGVIVMGVALVFIPSLSCSLCVFFSIVSIECGVLGFMVHWGINLDILSVLSLIMCIGFSVDFPAHVAQGYISSNYDTPEERVRDTLHSLGLPIVQSAASTLIAVSGLILVQSYLYQLFMRIVFLVMAFSVFHGIFVLPVLLLIFKPESSPMFSKSKTYVVNT